MEVPATILVLRDGNVDYTGSNDLFPLLAKRGIDQMRQIFADALDVPDAEQIKITQGSLVLTICMESRAGLDNLWSMYTSGNLTQRLSKILIADVLGEKESSCLTLQVTIEESDYEEALKFFKNMLEGIVFLTSDFCIEKDVSFISYSMPVLEHEMCILTQIPPYLSSTWLVLLPFTKESLSTKNYHSGVSFCNYFEFSLHLASLPFPTNC